jgi:hypothetical protein
MIYTSGEKIMIGDIVLINDGPLNGKGRVIIIGESGEYDDKFKDVAEWALSSHHVKQNSIMIEWLIDKSTPETEFFAATSNTLSLTIDEHVVFINRL